MSIIAQKKKIWYGGSQTYPYCAREIREYAALEPGFLTFGGHPLVNTFAQPYVRFDVPRIDEHLEVLWYLDLPHIDVRRAVPSSYT